MPASGNARWGWHRLAPSWAEQVVADAGVEPCDLVVDIGACTGAVTAPLVAARARVIAVELHPRRLAVLRDRFAYDDVTVVRADAADLRLPRSPFRVVANPPFALTSQILKRLLAPGSRLVRGDLVVQHPRRSRRAHRSTARRSSSDGRGDQTTASSTGMLPRVATE